MLKKPKDARRPLHIKEWLDHLQVSDEELGRRIGIARESAYRWHREQHRLTPLKLEQLAKALMLEPEDFWRRPPRRSVDAILRQSSDEDVQTVADLAQRLASRGQRLS